MKQEKKITMKTVTIMLDFLCGPIWKDYFNERTKTKLTGICGNSLLLEKTGGSCCLREDLTTVFDTDIANRLLSISYFLMHISGVWA